MDWSAGMVIFSTMQPREVMLANAGDWVQPTAELQSPGKCWQHAGLWFLVVCVLVSHRLLDLDFVSIGKTGHWWFITTCQRLTTVEAKKACLEIFGCHTCLQHLSCEVELSKHNPMHPHVIVFKYIQEVNISKSILLREPTVPKPPTQS